MSLRDLVLMQSRGMVYLPIINDQLMKDQEESKNKRKLKPKAIYPSGISHPCLRNLYYGFHRLPTPLKPAKTMRIFDVGNDMHERYNRYAKNAGILLVKELRIGNKEYRMRGRLDQIVLINQKLRLVELKSMNHNKFTELMGRPHDSHYDQLQIYFWILNELFKNKSKRRFFKKYEHLFPITEGSIVIEDKNNQEVEEFPMEYNQKAVEGLLQKIKEVLSFVDKGVLPPRGFGIDSMSCRFCDHRKECWKDN